MLESYKQLKVWQRSIELVKEIYKVTNQFPKSELYGLVSQMRRAVVSAPSNIAEGYKRKNLGGVSTILEYRRCLGSRVGDSDYNLKRFISNNRFFENGVFIRGSSENAFYSY